RRRHTISKRDWSSDVCSSDLNLLLTISHFLNQVPNREITLSGVDNDELMLSLASTNSAIQRTPINLIYQDALTNLLLQPADIMEIGRASCRERECSIVLDE